MEIVEEVIGVIRVNPKRYTDAFIDDPEGGPDIYVSRSVALDGDLVQVHINPQSEWKSKSSCVQKTGIVVKVIQRNHSGIGGGFLRRFSDALALFSPTDSRIPRMLIGLNECPPDFRTQPDRYKEVLFIAQMTKWDVNKEYARGKLLKLVGDSNMIESRIEVLLVENQIYDHEFPPEIYNELDYLNDLPADWFSKNSKNRRDLTDECIFTIDPKTARDLDDAVSIKQVAEQVYEVGVHIADVSFFVKELSNVDYHARLRTTSVYLVDRVIPMLPRPLCEHMCSLNPGEPKLTFSVIWKMNKYGRVIDQWFGRTIIRSCVKLSYEQAQDLISNQQDSSWILEGINMPELYNFNWKHISNCVVLLNKIAQNMRRKRFEDGALRIEQVKLKYELDPETGLPNGFSFEDRVESNYLIEEFMLLANMSVAKKIYNHSDELAFLRRHPASCPQVLKEVKEFCDAKGYPMDVTSAGSIQKSLNAISDKTTAKVVSFLLLRAMKNAEYICVGALSQDDKSFQHFALNVPFYTHFTSPIRRYADIIVHRQLAQSLGLEKSSNEDLNSLREIAAESTKRKISSKNISEASQKLYFNLFVHRAGFCELLACVTRIYDQCFEVILVDYNQTGRVYMERIKDKLVDFKFESSFGISRLVLKWKPLTKKSRRKLRKGHVSTEYDEKTSCRETLEKREGMTKSLKEFTINDPHPDKEQIVEVFDVIRVIVTVDPKDLSKLKIDLKTPF